MLRFRAELARVGVKDGGRPLSLAREELIGIAYAERQRLGRTIQYAPPAAWEQPSAVPGWWNRDVVAHLAGQDTAGAQLLKGDPPVELDEYRESLGDEPFTVDGLNAFLVDRRSGLPYREVLTLWGQAAEGLLAHASLLSDEDWRSKRFPWLSGDIAARYLVQSRIVEWWVHGEDIRATAGLGPAWEHWPIYMTVDMGVRMLPWALGQAGFELDGRSLRVDLEGAGRGTWHWGLSAGSIPNPEKEPDAFIQGRAPQFALVAARRLAPDEVLEAGNVVLGGDPDIAELVVRHIRAYV
jgi:uncharacterized protein (TIGR03083 family)